ncbi:hypothetical protein KC963_01415 [Candidatus Saccharibacteria bacterium]|nr:hypothetical protein [Candidatus Saccharibacteria bacterium]
MSKDPLAEFVFNDSGDDLFVSFKPDEGIKFRILTTDPLVSIDKFGNTRYAFVVWNYQLGKAQVLNKGTMIAKEIQRLHVDPDFGANIQKIDIKITATGEGKETRYSVQALSTNSSLTQEAIEEASKIKLDEIIKNGTRMSALNSGQSMPVASEPTPEHLPEPMPEDIPDEPINLDDIPF